MTAFYITTPIFYVNGAPHIGHAYTAFMADIFARHYRQRGRDVFFLTGTDEHGLKIQRAAEAQGITPKQLADKNSSAFRQLFDKMEISYDRFLRTTDEDHKKCVTEMVKRLQDAGYIYEGSYEGWYSASDEAFYDASEVEDGKSLTSGSSVEWIKEPSYFFKLSAFQDELLEWYDKNPECVQPSGRHKEIRSFVANGLRDLSITRTTFDWGISYPEDPKHVLYVWIDALTNYLTAVGGFDDKERREKFWPCDIHLIGKDILRFHAVYWPAFLMAAGLPLPKQVFAHGWWLNEGEKMSKSRNNFIDANDLINTYDLDLLRYYLVREIPLGSDGNFSHERIAQRNNSELADNLGNLVNRSFAMTQKFLNGAIPEINDAAEERVDSALRERCESVVTEVKALMDARRTADALELIMNLSSDLNQYCAVTQPWKLNKEGEVERLKVVLYHLLEGLFWVALLASPFIPHATQRILEALGLPNANSLADLGWGRLPTGFELKNPGVLFEKYDLDKVKADLEAGVKIAKSPKQSGNPSKKGSKSADSGLVSFNEFLRVELRCAKILTAEKVEGADKLLRLTVDIGEAQPRQIVAGIAKSYEPEQLIGKHVAVVANLQPATIFKIESQGMLLAAETSDGKLLLTEYPDSVLPGTRIK